MRQAWRERARPCLFHPHPTHLDLLSPSCRRYFSALSMVLHSRPASQVPGCAASVRRLALAGDVFGCSKWGCEDVGGGQGCG